MWDAYRENIPKALLNEAISLGGGEFLKGSILLGAGLIVLLVIKYPIEFLVLREKEDFSVLYLH